MQNEAESDSAFGSLPQPSSLADYQPSSGGKSRAFSCGTEGRKYLRFKESPMRPHYDFSAGTKNPYAKRLKRSVTIRLDESTVEYFKSLAAETELPYQSLINLYLRDCAASGRRLSMTWKQSRTRAG